MRILTFALALEATFCLASCGETCKVCTQTGSIGGTEVPAVDLGEKCGTELVALEAAGTQTDTTGGIATTITITCK